ncbi:MAG: SDR family oxidoreductase [Blastocatellia bacterium]|jgi:NAD(P)-dependent dehydrogenase (short-subunit alcohol dehydrogenase family)
MNQSELFRMYDFTGKTVAITGGAGVLCGAMATALVSCGANVAILDREPEKAQPLIDRLQGPGSALALFTDVLKPEVLRENLAQIVEKFGRLDYLINGAGGNSPGATTRPDQTFFDIPESALRFVFDLNMLGTIFPCQVFGRSMAEQGEGVILNVSSMSAFRPLTRVLGYSAAKAGISNFTQWLAVHLAQEYSKSLRVNAIAPGFLVTDQNRNLLLDAATGELTPRGRSIVDHTPMGRFGDPEDLLGTVLWLLSPASSFVTGAVIPIDGGFAAFAGV